MTLIFRHFIEETYSCILSKEEEVMNCFRLSISDTPNYISKMIRVIGKYTSAEIFAEHIEDAALQWIKAQCDHPAFESVKIVQMPDVHAGKSCNVGTAYRIGTYLNPDHVGVDIGCTISMHRLSSRVAPEDFALLDYKIPRLCLRSDTADCTKRGASIRQSLGSGSGRKSATASRVRAPWSAPARRPRPYPGS